METLVLLEIASFILFLVLVIIYAVVILLTYVQYETYRKKLDEIEKESNLLDKIKKM